MQKYRILGKKGEGTFSEVLKCQNIENGQYYACKRMKQHFDSLDRVNNLREIQCMRRLSPHANIVDLKEVIFDKKTGTLALIIELLDMNLYELIKGRRNFLTESKCRQYIYQTLKALDHMHRNGIFHRDIKPENILLKDDVVKLAVKMKAVLLLLFLFIAVQAHIPFEDDEVIEQLQDFLKEGSDDEEADVNDFDLEEEFDDTNGTTEAPVTEAPTTTEEAATTEEPATTVEPATTKEPITLPKLSRFKKPSKVDIILRMILKSIRRLSYGQRRVAFKIKQLYKKIYGDFYINTHIAKKLMAAQKMMEKKFAKKFYQMMKKKLEHDE